ncbi:hypothetical protein NQU36_27630, partial [Escherichia coli]|uniref:hypothetical protein n=1 Tax=Escherichia coli TaxID=562 RepID=UPI0021198C1E
LSSSNDTRLPQPSPSLQQHPDDLLDHMEYFPRKACPQSGVAVELHGATAHLSSRPLDGHTVWPAWDLC